MNDIKMRQLTDIETKEIRKAIMQKELSSAEILMEIYDHYISHLQEFPEEEFKKQLFELDQKFSYAYCHALQAKFNKKIRKDLGEKHWQLLRKNLCLSRILYVLGFMVLAFYLGSHVKSGKEGAILMVAPLFILMLFHIYFLFKSGYRIKKIKQEFSHTGTLQSSLFYPLSERMYLPAILAYSIAWFSEILFDIQLLSNIAPQLSAIFSILLFIYVISLLEVWKIKSKTALI